MNVPIHLFTATPVPALALVLRCSALGAFVGGLVACRAQRRFAHADHVAITTAWTALGDVIGYAAFRGPGKLEGSIVNWLNGPVFQLVGERGGFHVGVEPFAYRGGSNTVVLCARPRDAFSRSTQAGRALAVAA